MMGEFQPPLTVIRCWQVVAAGQPCPSCNVELAGRMSAFNHTDDCIVSRWGRALADLHNAVGTPAAEDAERRLAKLARTTERRPYPTGVVGTSPPPPPVRPRYRTLVRRWRTRVGNWIAGANR